jgi:predicted transposase/invertase (TIGR01784 family)
MRLSEERYISLLTDFGFKQELREYEDSLKAYRDIKNSIDTAKEEGREEGRVEGVAKEKLATAKRLLGMGLTQEQVAKGTDLSIEDIERLV